MVSSALALWLVFVLAFELELVLFVVVVYLSLLSFVHYRMVVFCSVRLLI